MSAERREVRPTVTTPQRAAPGPVTEPAHDIPELPVPRVDEDDYAPTIIRGRE